MAQQQYSSTTGQYPLQQQQQYQQQFPPQYPPQYSSSSQYPPQPQLYQSSQLQPQAQPSSLYPPSIPQHYSSYSDQPQNIPSQIIYQTPSYFPPSSQPQYQTSSQYPPQSYQSSSQYPPQPQPQYQPQPQTSPYPSYNQGTMTAGGGGGGGGVGSWYEKYYKQLGPGQIEHLKKWFDSVDKDRSGSIDANELSNMIMPGTGNYAGRKIGLPAAKSLINLFDYNHSGSIDFEEYAALHNFLEQLHSTFYRADTDRSGSLDSREISSALLSIGFSISPLVINHFFQKYDKSHRGLDFVTFMQMITEIAYVKSMFEWADKDKDGKIGLEELFLITGEMAQHSSKQSSSSPSLDPSPSSFSSSQQNCSVM